MMTNPVGRITQGQFSYLPDLTDAEISLQIDYGLGKGYAWSVEYTDDPHPRNTYWEMFGIPMFDLKDAAGVLMEVQNCRKTFPAALHPAHGFRFHARRRIHRDELHRESSGPRTGLRIAAPGGARPHASATPCTATPPTAPRPNAARAERAARIETAMAAPQYQIPGQPAPSPAH